VDVGPYPYKVTDRIEGAPPPVSVGDDHPARGLLAAWAGATFANGLYRVHTRASAESLIPALQAAFPAVVPGYTPFGFDWLGRQFLVAGDTLSSGPVVMLEPGTGEALEIPVSVSAFHMVEIVNEPDAALAAGYFSEWLTSNGRPIRHNEAVGYRVPLFLGGVDELANLEIVNLDVYWSIASQLIAGVRGLPPGARVGVQRPDDIHKR
jgi:hypothetical protein